MEKYIDLHIHSRHSDGLHSPAELVRMAAEKGLRAIAIADHDSVDGIDSAMDEGKRLGVEVIPAVELSVSYGDLRDIHLLGYLIDHRDRRFNAMLAEFRHKRDERVKAILERINSRLSDGKREGITYAEVQAHAFGALGRPHIAKVLVERGYSRSIEEAFDKYLGPCNIPKLYIHVSDAIGEVKRIGGVAVLAHPPSISSNPITLGNVVREFSAMGLDGLELYSNMCYKDDIIFINTLAKQFGLLVTGGSDFHGLHSDEELGKVQGGVRIPYQLLERLKEARAVDGMKGTGAG
jgi:predicted metal-dependent phosphoesterase TrpH